MRGIGYLAASIVLCTFTSSTALVTGNIQIVGKSGGTQFLPGSYVSTFPRWNAEVTGDETISLSRLLGSGLDRLDPVPTLAQQFVDPTSNEELWWPADLQTLQVRPTLDFFLKNATPEYVLAGMEVRVPSDSSQDGKEWKNFGMNSQPLASQWTTFDIAVENGFRVEMFYGKILLTNKDEDDVIVEWKALRDDHPADSCVEDEISSIEKNNIAMEYAKGTQNALGTFGNLLAGMDESSPLAHGMHIVSVPITTDWIDLPVPDGENGYKLVSVGTVDSDAKELLNLDTDLVAMSAASILKVEVTRIAPGSESEFMPEAYIPLYKN